MKVVSEKYRKEEENPDQVLGVLRHDDLSHAYNQEINRRKNEQ